ncbi:hypothetical protein [Streptomyces sp. NL15-2K]|uniref:hypothetical protein n=1 Tax=Streptomyces sp. NL15-2K TaxID=376149 RepID=UPI000F567DFA|nr:MULTISPECIES: hypothetical protein [Actinomycetes]WKX09434.1 hypothetical protein Q4V64_18860 [Kutzneria buriramensis]GCB49058.1 hypothetical protein SNL152K_6388 [Streptomyces sp. NL15-2K]
MGSLRLTVCTAVLAVAALIPIAHAADGGGSISATPSSPAPGAEVALRVSGCAGKTATAASTAFVADARLTGSGGTLAGETRVRSSIEPGPYEVKVSCADSQLNGTLTVAAGGSSARPGASAAASPVAPVQAGGGGAARLAATDAREAGAGPGVAQTVTGLVLAGVAAVAVVIRGRRRSRGTG